MGRMSAVQYVMVRIEYVCMTRVLLTASLVYIGEPTVLVSKCSARVDISDSCGTKHDFPCRL